jgi:hypothetical protein
VADLGFSGGGWFRGRGEGAGGGYPLPPGVRGFFEAMFRQYLFISSLYILNKNVN